MSATLTLAILVGVTSAAALPLGSIAGLTWRPGPRFTSALMAFGAGALLFALSIEIVAGSLEEAGFLPLAVGALLGGLAFEAAAQALNRRGGFLRKVAIAVRQVSREKRRRARELLSQLAEVRLLQALPPDEIAPLVHAAATVRLMPGEELFREGDAGVSLYLIHEGELEVVRGGVQVAVLGPGEAVGEIAVVLGAPRSATIRALTAARLSRIAKREFDRLVETSPEVRRRVAELITLRTEELKQRLLLPQADAHEWQARAAARLADYELPLTADEIRNAAQTHGRGSPVLAIWLGNLLDAIPESLVLGTTVTAGGALSWPLLAGVFLANFPEAMSSSGIMRTAGLRIPQILAMWGSIVVVAGLFAGLGNVFLEGASHQIFGVIEGTAAGAMLVMTAETMLPEAYERGGAIVGMCTLLGFLAALFVKSIA